MKRGREDTRGEPETDPAPFPIGEQAQQDERQMKLAKLARAYGSFVRAHHLVRNATTESVMLNEVCRAVVEDLGFRLAWIGLTRPEDFRVVPVAQAGFEDGYLESAAITWSDDEHGLGPTGRAIRERRSCVSRDIATDERFAPWRADALRRGYASSAAIPLCDGTHCFGALNLYAAEPDAFDDDELALLEEMALDVLLGMLRLRSAERLEEMSARLERAARAETAGMVMAALAHDLNNVLQAAAFAVEAAREAPEGALREENLGEAARAVDSAVSMMRQISALSRRTLDGGDQTDTDRVLGTLGSLLARLVGRATLEMDLGAAGASVRIPALDLDRIAINLVVNAAHAAHAVGPETVILVRTVRRRVGLEGVPVWEARLPSGDYVELSVKDEGPGIAADVLPRIFDPFFTTKAAAGSGLGLASVLHLVREAGGAVAVESRVGVGTRFSVFLPVVSGSVSGDEG